MRALNPKSGSLETFFVGEPRHDRIKRVEGWGGSPGSARPPPQPFRPGRVKADNTGRALSLRRPRLCFKGVCLCLCVCVSGAVGWELRRSRSAHAAEHTLEAAWL